jgi:hypothetical protein
MRPRPDAILTVGVDERTVDGLIHAVHGTPLEPARWLVFGSHMRLLGLIEGHWRDFTEITVGHIPDVGPEVRDGVQAIAELEGLRRSACVWLDGGAAADLPTDFALAVSTRGLTVGALADALRDFCAAA